MRSKPTTVILAAMHPYLHMQLAGAIIDERLRDAEARRRIGQARQLGGRRSGRLRHTVTCGQSAFDRSRAVAKAGVRATSSQATKGQP